MKITDSSKLRSRRLIVPVTATMAVWLTTVVLPAAPQAGQPAPPAKPQLAGQAFKNITTSSLRELTVDDFLGAMGVMAGALAYDCSNCHPGAGFSGVDWVSDAFPTKVMARRMVEMVATINRTNFGNANAQMVTCWTCHRG